MSGSDIIIVLALLTKETFGASAYRYFKRCLIEMKTKIVILCHSKMPRFERKTYWIIIVPFFIKYEHFSMPAHLVYIFEK